MTRVGHNLPQNILSESFADGKGNQFMLVSISPVVSPVARYNWAYIKDGLAGLWIVNVTRIHGRVA